MTDPLTYLDEADARYQAATDATIDLYARQLAEFDLMTEDVPALSKALRAALEVHRRAHAVFSWNEGVRYLEPCPECDGKAGVHSCGCWADTDIEYVCAECHRLGSGSKGVYDYAYPCPTVQAIQAALAVNDEGGTR